MFKLGDKVLFVQEGMGNSATIGTICNISDKGDKFVKITDLQPLVGQIWNHNILLCYTKELFPIEEEVYPERASKEQVRAHTKALRDRDKWRFKFNTLSKMIKDMKKENSCEDIFARENDYLLSILQDRVNDLMRERANITERLTSTAYKWV